MVDNTNIIIILCPRLTPARAIGSFKCPTIMMLIDSNISSIPKVKDSYVQRLAIFFDEFHTVNYFISEISLLKLSFLSSSPSSISK